MKKPNRSDGFSIVELVVAAVLLCIIGFAGYAVNRTDHKAQSKSSSSNVYDFKKLGISMNILPGWTVKEDTDSTNVNGKEYTWEVRRAGADGYILMDSYINMAGPPFITCDKDSTFTPVTVLDYSRTRNTNLVFLSWRINADNFGYTNLASPTEKFFFTSKNLSSRIENQNVKPGDYYACSDATAGTGSSLDLSSDYINDNPNRLNTIKAYDSSDRPLAYSAKSYPEIKAMLISVR